MDNRVSRFLGCERNVDLWPPRRIKQWHDSSSQSQSSQLADSWFPNSSMLAYWIGCLRYSEDDSASLPDCPFWTNRHGRGRFIRDMRPGTSQSYLPRRTTFRHSRHLPGSQRAPCPILVLPGGFLGSETMRRRGSGRVRTERFGSIPDDAPGSATIRHGRRFPESGTLIPSGRIRATWSPVARPRAGTDGNPPAHHPGGFGEGGDQAGDRCRSGWRSGGSSPSRFGSSVQDDSACFADGVTRPHVGNDV